MFKNQERNLSLKAVAVAVAATVFSNFADAQSLPSTAACNSLTRAYIAAFRADVGTETTGAIDVLTKANIAATPPAGAGAANSTLDLLDIANRLDETVFLAPPCKSMFYPDGTANPNNIHACFRVDITPPLEHAIYWSTIHLWYNKVDYSSRQSAENAFYAVRNLLKNSRKISNDALTCLFESTGDPAFGGP